MGAIRLTQSFVNAAMTEKKRTRYFDTVVPGLALSVTNTGNKKYVAIYRDVEGKQREPIIGNARHLTLEQARTVAREMLAGAIVNGRDPIAERRRAREEAMIRHSRTFEKLHDAYCADTKRKRSPARQELELMYSKKHLLPRFGDRPVIELTPDDIEEAFKEIGAKSGYSCANTNLEVLRQMLTFAVSRDWVVKNAARDIEPFPKQSRERVGTAAEVRTIWNGLVAAEREGRSDGRAAAQAIQLAFLTLQRRGEAAGVHWREIDWEERIWTLPGKRTKNKKGPHLVPLSKAAVDLLHRAFGRRTEGYAFRGRGEDAVDAHVLTRAFSRLTAEWGISDFTIHDLRRTGATMLTSERLNVMGEIVSRILNHTPPGPAVTLIYNRNSYLPQKRTALDAWAREIERLAGLQVAQNATTDLSHGR